MHQVIFLVGPRGAGKTTIGETLAAQIGYTFADTDLYILEKNSKTVTEIVAEEGWQGFRNKEQKALYDVTRPQTVISTGGGMPLLEENRLFMRNNGLVFYLSAPLKTLVERLSYSPNSESRPSLTGKPLLDELQDILIERESLYHATAHRVIDASQTPDAIVKSIRQFL